MSDLGDQETKSESVSNLPGTHSQICQEGQSHEVTRLRRISHTQIGIYSAYSYKCANFTVHGRCRVRIWPIILLQWNSATIDVHLLGVRMLPSSLSPSRSQALPGALRSCLSFPAVFRMWSKPGFSGPIWHNYYHWLFTVAQIASSVPALRSLSKCFRPSPSQSTIRK